MRMPVLRPLKWTLLWIAVSAGASAAAPGEVPPSLMSAAECMARVARAMPGVANVEITVTPDQRGGYPVLSYTFSDAAGRRRFTELSLFQIEGMGDAPFVFDRADVLDDIVAERLLPVWKAQCRAGLGYITSVPR
jgi:hypothetical protein